MTEHTIITPEVVTTPAAFEGHKTENLIKDWIRFLQLGSPRSVRTYQNAMKQFLIWMVDNQVSNPTRNDLILFKEYLLENGKKPSTVKVYLIAVRSFFDYLSDEMMIYPKITTRIKAPKVTKEHKRDYLTPAQIQELLGSICTTTEKGKRDYAMILLMATTGLRCTSISHANIEDLRPRGNNTVLYYKGKGHLEKDTFVKVPPKTEQAIRAYLETRKDQPEDAPLFSSVARGSYGDRISPDRVSKNIKDRFKGIGLLSRRLSAHSLRHSACVILLTNGGTLEDAQRLLNHQDPASTMVYSHILEREQSTSELTIEQVILG